MIRNRSIVRGVRATTLVAVAVSAVVVGCATFMGSPGAPVVELDVDSSGCDAPHLEWKSARKTNYTSYPEPGSEECIVYSGCKYEGLFYACESKKSEAWVKTHNIAAFFPNVGDYKLHDLCIRSGEKTMVVTVYDTCGDQDCDGCCTKNKGDADALIDLESYTNARFGVADGPIQWADLGPTKSEGCSGGDVPKVR